MFTQPEAVAVRKRYGSLTALDGVSPAVEEGEFFGLLGPNGGQTTLISIIAGLCPRRQRPGERDGARRGLRLSGGTLQPGVVPQETGVRSFFSRCAKPCVSSPVTCLRHNDARIDEILANLGLTDQVDANMRSLAA